MKRRKRRPRIRLPMTLRGLIEAGGPEGMVRRAMVRAANDERHFWLNVLEAQPRPVSYVDAMMLAMYVRDLRRKLGIRPPKEVIRAQTRERVRRFRERQRSEAHA